MILHTGELDSIIYHDALMIRHKVFVEEQQRPRELEFAYDEASCLHLVYYHQDLPAGTVRLLPVAPDLVKIQRMAILPEFRGQKLGSQLINAAEELASAYGYPAVVLDAQEHAIPFYEKMNYVPTGEPAFIRPNATIKNLPMIKQLAGQLKLA